MAAFTVTFDDKHRDLTLTVDGVAIASAHCVSAKIDRWSVVRIAADGKRTMVGLAPSRAIADTTLNRLGQQATA